MPRLVRIPDVSFYSWAKFPGKHYPSKPIPDLAPDLAVEVVSPGDQVEELDTRLDEFFRAGVRVVWVVHCHLRHIHIFESLTSIRVVTAADELDGGNVLPGFRVPIANLFPPMTAEDQTPQSE